MNRQRLTLIPVHFLGSGHGTPVRRNSRRASPEDTYAVTKAGLEAGADRVILSRKYSEMVLANLSGTGGFAREVRA